MEDHPAACDIYSLGELLHKLIILHHFYWEKNVDKILTKYSEKYKEEFALSKLMKAPID
jgi:hypothetical protein